MALFNTYTQKHHDKQAINPFSQQNVHGMDKRRFSNSEYGRPEKGTKTEYRGLVASLQVYKELLELCDIIDEFGQFGKDSRKFIEFGELFDVNSYFDFSKTVKFLYIIIIFRYTSRYRTN